MNEIGPNWRAHLVLERRFQWSDYEWIWRLGLAGPSVKLALETLARIYYGVTATHERPFSKDDKDAVSSNRLVMGRVKNGAVTFAYPEPESVNRRPFAHYFFDFLVEIQFRFKFRSPPCLKSLKPLHACTRVHHFGV